ncbi:hypothetical protein [Spirulina sp. 06S082]|uniref:hypothetical protein n=1 Tax=Spirulina sp. 06S082 TaxID=3110248 RepID=UPI002B2037C8|nr:hypothetical protein [Spirulina sp. 06S082]MEA5470374.1 hypothetical protein [Spirulina sp. 06S082]
MNFATFTKIKQYLLLLAIALLGWGCSNMEDKDISSVSDECPKTPEIVLKSENVQAIDLSSEEMIMSGNVSRRKHKAYRFEAKAGDRFNYQTQEDLCLWFYNPENELLEETKFEQDGNYIVQISVPQGSATFELAMSLTNEENVSSSIAKQSPSSTTISNNSPPQSNITISSNSPPQNSSSSIARTDPKESIKKYYSYINNEEYPLAWEMLTYLRKQDKKIHPDGYNSFYNWWVTVDRVNIKDIIIITVDNDTSIVDVEYNYHMKKGSISPESLRFTLEWNEEKGEWEISTAKAL